MNFQGELKSKEAKGKSRVNLNTINNDSFND